MALKARHRLGVLVSHPIQYYAPWFRDLATKLDLQVFYSHRQDAQGQSAAGFGVEFDWDTPLLDGYSYQWLENKARHPGIDHFFGCDHPQLFDIVDPSRFDAFLVFGWNRKSSWQALRACWRKGVPVMMRGDSQAAMVTSTLKRMIKAVPYRWFLPRINAHLYPGVRNREYLQSFGVQESQLFWCPHFVDTHFFGSRAQRALEQDRVSKLRREFGISQDAFVALFVGKLIAKKNPLDFISAVKRAACVDPSIHGVIVGSGPLESECRAGTADMLDRVHFASFQNQTQLPAYYALADALVLPSDGTETWGLVVNEAMACGTPCIVSSACGCGPDMIDHGETGFVYRRGDVSDLSDAILSLKSALLDNPKRIAQNLSRKSAKYSLAAASESLRDAIESITAGTVCT